MGGWEIDGSFTSHIGIMNICGRKITNSNCKKLAAALFVAVKSLFGSYTIFENRLVFKASPNQTKGFFLAFPFL